jgi:hypothetical protein
MAIAVVGAASAGSILTRDWQARRMQMCGEVSGTVATGGRLEGAMVFARPLLLCALLPVSFSYLAGETYNPFIYFRF